MYFNNNIHSNLIEQLKEKRLCNGEYIGRLKTYQNRQLCNDFFIEACGQQINLIQIQFRNVILYLSEMFVEGINESEHGWKFNDEIKTRLFSSVDALYVSLVIYRLSFGVEDLLNEKILGEEYDMTLNQNSDVVRGMIAGAADYLAAAAMHNLHELLRDSRSKSYDNNMLTELYRVQNEILNWYSFSIERVQREQKCLISSDRKDIIQNLEEIWENTRCISLFSLGKICAGGNAEPNDEFFKEFEFWLTFSWIIDNINENFSGSCYLDKDNLNTYMDKIKKENFKYTELLKFCVSNGLL